MLKRYLLVLPLLAWFNTAMADDEAVKAKFESLVPGMKIDSVAKLADTNFYEAVIGGEILYFSEDGQYAIQGDVIDLKTRLNLTESKRNQIKKQALAELNEDDMIVYEPKKVEHTLTVFTDIDCGYCRKLHQQMAEYNDLGIRIRYMAFPRSGPGSESYNKAVSVWCSKDKQQALTDSKRGLDIAQVSCENPVAKHFEVGRKMGVTGTPALFLENGELLPGYVPPKELKKILDEHLG